MSDYRVATGTSVALGSLTVIAPQPHSNGVQSTRRTFAADDSVYDEGKFIELEFDFSEDPTTYVALLTLFGVNVSLTAAVTVYIPDERLASIRYNGTAVRPQPGRDMVRRNYFPRDITILVKNLTVA